jgi:predicted 3-demethylubiquinone-9 3-methyltransferase (glyoxalase superfamily)
MQRITPFLWFDNQAEDAANFYVATFANSRIVQVSHYGEAGPGPKGCVMTVTFELEGQAFIALNGGPQFEFNEAISFVVNCETQDQIDGLWDRLTSGGQPVQCGWLKDRYGVSWQIVPTELGELLGGPDPAGSQRAMKAMLQMKKLEIETLRQAYEQG